MIGTHPRMNNAVVKYGKENASQIVKSHETDHALHNPDKPIESYIFDFGIMDDEMKEYFSKKNNTELAARGS